LKKELSKKKLTLMKIYQDLEARMDFGIRKVIEVKGGTQNLPKYLVCIEGSPPI
jgi:hypothetical protein